MHACVRDRRLEGRVPIVYSAVVSQRAGLSKKTYRKRCERNSEAERLGGLEVDDENCNDLAGSTAEPGELL